MSKRRAARRALAFCLLGGLIAAPASAAPSPNPLADAPADAPLSLSEAMRLSLQAQPLLASREAMVEAQRQQAVAAAQLPDPRLSGGLKDLPIDTGEAGSFRRDNFTEFMVGVSQDFPRAEKRRLRGERRQLAAEAEHAALEDDRRSVQRDAALGWLEVYESEQSLQLSRALADEAALEVQSLQSRYTTAKASEADWLAARVEQGLAEDKAHDWLHHVQRMRAGLARWIGADAERPLAALPQASALPATLPGLVAMLERHPLVAGENRQIAAADADLALARQAYKPDWSVEAYVAYRPDFADFAGLQFSIDLPYFTAKRQDRELEAARQQSLASQSRKEDLLRRLKAEVAQDWLDWQHYQARTAEFAQSILPDAQRRVDAARGAYAAGRGSFAEVLAARRGLLEVQLQRLALNVEAARAQVRLRYFLDDPTGDAP